jgi:hypothetical protein
MIDSTLAHVIALRKQLESLEAHLAEETAVAWVVILKMDDHDPDLFSPIEVRAVSPHVPVELVDPEDKDERVVIRGCDESEVEHGVDVYIYEVMGHAIETSCKKFLFHSWIEAGSYKLHLARSRERAQELLASCPEQGNFEEIYGVVVEDTSLDDLRDCDWFCEGGHCTSCHRPPQAEVPDFLQCEQTPTMSRVPQGVDMDAVVDTLMTGLTAFDDGGCSCMVNRD